MLFNVVLDIIVIWNEKAAIKFLSLKQTMNSSLNGLETLSASFNLCYSWQLR